MPKAELELMQDEAWDRLWELLLLPKSDADSLSDDAAGIESHALRLVPSEAEPECGKLRKRL